MDTPTRKALNAINLAFYARHAEAFSDTREHPWPGWDRVLARFAEREPEAAGAVSRVLDFACGNGRFAGHLADRHPTAIDYCGVDASAPLLREAQKRCQPLARAKLVEADWVLEATANAIPTGPFDLVVAFGALHHVPGFEARREIVRALAERVAPGGLLAIAFWRFGAPEHAERFAVRMAPLRETAPCYGFDPGDLEAGDHLLRWGDASHRYCHYSDDTEIEALLAGLALERVDSFLADGRGGNLNRYELLAA